jgi:hypothetical protein
VLASPYTLPLTARLLHSKESADAPPVLLAPPSAVRVHHLSASVFVY